jgi:hypothetical protein
VCLRPPAGGLVTPYGAGPDRGRRSFDPRTVSAIA